MNFESAPKEKINFPEGLTPRDIELIRAQCQYQHAVGKEQVEGFARAYKLVKELALNKKELEDFTPGRVFGLVLELGKMVESRNLRGFREVEVRFRGGGTALPAEQVRRAMLFFSEQYADFIKNPPTAEEMNWPLAKDPTRLYKEFEEIHPFEDGNGRVGDLLWKLAVTRSEGGWPQELPPEVFGKPSSE